MINSLFILSFLCLEKEIIIKSNICHFDIEYKENRIKNKVRFTTQMSSSNGGGVSTLLRAKQIIMVLSGKGGVGKSTVACQLAFIYAYRYGLNVGILDVDLCGPSVPIICGVENKDIFRNGEAWVPVLHPHPGSPSGTVKGSLKIMSIAFLLPSDKDAVAWRGPKKNSMLQQFIESVDWGELDLLIIDTPPGTSDEHLTICSLLQDYHPAGAVLVTTPQGTACDDVKKELSLCHLLHLRCLGVVQNMSGFVCPHCSTCTHVFSSGGGERLAELYKVPFLGSIPLDPRICVSEDAGAPFFALGEEEVPQQVKDGNAEYDHDSKRDSLYGVAINLQLQLKRVDPTAFL